MVATPMPTEPALNIGSPRTRAAMKVLGILPQDVQQRHREHFDEGVPGDVRHEAWETKRRQLMHSVHGMASDKSLDLTKSQSEGALNKPSDATNAFLADVFAREQASIDKMHRRAKEQVQKIVLDEMTAKAQVAVREQKLEEHRQRMVKLKKERDEKLKERAKEAAKKKEKTDEVRRRADKKLEEESEALKLEIEKKDARVKATLEAREEGWEENRVTKQAERDANYSRIGIFKMEYLKDCEATYSKSVTRTKASEQRLAELQEELQAHQAAKSDRTDGVIANARRYLGEAQAEKDKAFLKREEEHGKAAEKRKEFAKERKMFFVKQNETVRKTFLKNYEAAMKEAENSIKISPRMTKSMSGAFTQSPAWQTEDSMKAFETHKTMGELRQLNLQLIARAHQHQQQQALHKIQDMRHRVAALRASKEEAQDRRYDMMKNVAIEKHKLSFQVTKVRDAPPEKMNSLLEHMGLPPIKMGKDEEAGEEEKK